MQPFFGYPGGKSRAVKQIIKVLGLDMQKYDRIVEPFCGGGAFTLGTLGNQRAWLNDLDHDLMCLWQAVIRYPEDLCEAIQGARIKASDFYRLQAKLLSGLPKVERRDAVVRRALDKLVVHKISFSNMGEMSGSPVGGRKQTGKWKFDCRWKPDLICKRVMQTSELLSSAYVSDWTFPQVMKYATPRDFFFVDPPYVEAGKKCYKHSFTLDDHVRLAEYLKRLPCDWTLTYDYHPHVLGLYKWATIYDLEFNYFMSSAYRAGETMKVGKELLITRKR
jgi:DNA adenine methylase